MIVPYIRQQLSRHGRCYRLSNWIELDRITVGHCAAHEFQDTIPRETTLVILVELSM